MPGMGGQAHLTGLIGPSHSDRALPDALLTEQWHGSHGRLAACGPQPPQTSKNSTVSSRALAYACRTCGAVAAMRAPPTRDRSQSVPANETVDHVTIRFYDSDYPSQHLHASLPENFDETTVYQGLRYDVERYRELARDANGPVLELCCGTGRVAIPLARDGYEVTGVDQSAGMLDRFRMHLEREPADVRGRVTLIEQDVTCLALDRRDFALAVMAFNSLPCIADFTAQRRALSAIAAHLSPGGVLVLDLVNPLALKLEGDPVPRPFFTRRNVISGNRYTRFAMFGPLDADQRQRLHGWYDEESPEGAITRYHYSIVWRPIFRFEIELMLAEAGFDIASIEGGHRGEPFTTASPRMFIRARRQEGTRVVSPAGSDFV